MTTEQQSWWKKLLAQYDQLCKDLGVEGGACRGCVPVVKFDPENEPPKADGSSEQKTE